MTPQPREALIAARGALPRAKLAEILGLSREHVFSVETGRRYASPDTMVRWARALGAPIAKIWPEEDLARVKLRFKVLRRAVRQVA